MKSVFFKILRDQYTNKATLGNIFLNNVFFGHTLEDVVRGIGIKIKGDTAISAGHYIIEVRMNAAGKKKVYVNDVPLFVAIQCHGGNDDEDTRGCPLVAANRYTNTIQGSLEDEMIQIVEKADYAYLEIINLNQLQP